MSNHNFQDDVHDEHMGLMASYRWHHDPKTILFVLARYKFVARLLQGVGNVLEVGCADAFGSRIVRQAVGKLTALDIDGQMIEDAKKRTSTKWDILYVLGDMSAVGGERFDALYCLDVLEHVLPSEEGKFMSMAAELAPVAVIGMPSLESQPFASDFSRDNHVNCKTEYMLRELMQRYYKHVFMFGMNDEVVHTGFGPLCHYRFALGGEMKVMDRAVDELRYYLRAWRSWVRAWRTPLGLPSAVAWLGVMPPTPAWDIDDADPTVDTFILRAIDAEIESLPANKRAAVRQYYLNEALSTGKSTREEVRRLVAEAEAEMVPRLRSRGVVLGES